ncbi:MAG: VanZ family protein [Porticoccaceae bacterium]|nr:VanZ family protein [Pseudomonadales bacterium]MCP5302565.1 VanZ family protein [Pseudomonadales bacterium]
MNHQPAWFSAMSNHALFKSIWGAIFLASLVSILVLSILPDSGAEQRFPGQDKMAHAIGFFWLYVTGWLGLRVTSSTALLALSLAVYGVLIEALQYLGGYRSAELLDFAADVFGIALGFVVTAKFFRATSES